MILAKPNLAGLNRCPHCNIANPLIGYRSHFFYPPANSQHINGWVNYQCSSCHNLIGAKCYFDISAIRHPFPDYLQQMNVEVQEVIPSYRYVDESIPDRPRKYLEQALQSLHAPDGAIMLAGSAVDSMLKLKGYSEGSVYQRINEAESAHIITSEMAKWAHAVRLESNKPRHADRDDPHATPEIASRTIEFVQALGDFLFVLPARIALGEEKSKEAEALAATNDQVEF